MTPLKIAALFAGGAVAILLTKSKRGVTATYTDASGNVETEEFSVTDAAASVVESVGQTVSDAVAAIVEFGSGFNVLKLADGSTIRRDGARNWRNNNPGNIEYGSFAKSHGAIGSDGRFAIFPTYAAGRAAKAALIFESNSYKNLTLAQAIMRYAPPSENDTANYRRIVLAAVDGRELRMAEYSSSDREKILDAMERIEGFKVGNVSVISST